MPFSNRWFYLFLLLTVGATLHAGAQQSANATPCSMPAFPTLANQPNIFTEEQEDWLGDTIAAKINSEFNTIADPEGDYLQKLGNRLLAQLPPSRINYRFTIIDLPENNSFGIFGGRIYISRKIIALARNEDELAGLLGHEIGHIITRQPAIEFSQIFNMVLGVNKLGDKKDVLEKWNRLLDTFATHPLPRGDKRSNEDQLIADRIALYAMARAGYQPSRFVDFFDRLAQTKGNKGSFWTDFFGRTSADSKRLRELVRNATPLAQGCITPVTSVSNDHFQRWQQAVIGAKFDVVKEDVPGLLDKKALNPPLRSDIRNIQFSPDGNYLLAQDDTAIFVLKNPAVTLLFSVDAPDSHLARFSPDSQSIVFYDKELRVETWSVSERKRVSAHQPSLTQRCIQTTLSHSGEILACLNPNLEVQLVDVNTSTVLFTGRKLRAPSEFSMAVFSFLMSQGLAITLFNMQFSPDDHYFLTGGEQSAFGYDLLTHNEIKLPNNLRQVAGSGSFTFLEANEIAGYGYQGKVGDVLRAKFPSGEILDTFIGNMPETLSAPVRGNYLLMHHSNGGVTVFDLQTKRRLMDFKKPVFSVYNKIYAVESASGELGIFNLADKKYIGGIDLPNGPLDAARAFAFSPDGKWLAMSGSSRGGIWKVDSGERTLLTWGFDGAFFDQDQLVAKCPAPTNQKAGIFKFDAVSSKIQNLYVFPPRTAPLSQLEDILLKVDGSQSGRKGIPAFLMEVFDIRANKKLWERPFERERPHVFYSASGKTLTVVVGDYEAMKSEAGKDPRLAMQLNALGDEKRKKMSYIVLPFDAGTGKSLGSMVVDSGNLSFRVRNATTVGDTVMVSTSGLEDRILLFSLRTGEKQGELFGFVRAVSTSTHTLLVENGKQELTLYDMPELQSLVHFSFPSQIGHAEFSSDGRSLLIVTVDQTVYSVKTPEPRQSAAVQ